MQLVRADSCETHLASIRTELICTNRVSGIGLKQDFAQLIPDLDRVQA
jgi:hypothetical protein